MTEFTPGMEIFPWLDPRLEVRSVRKGEHGLFACMPINVGEVVLRWGGVVYRREDILAGKANPETIAILDSGLYLADPVDKSPDEDYPLNHSCDPNLWMQDAITLVARRFIFPDEEVTADYALWMYDQNWRMENCQCGSSLCRGRISDQDWKLTELQNRYKDHFSPFLNQRIKYKELYGRER